MLESVPGDFNSAFRTLKYVKTSFRGFEKQSRKCETSYSNNLSRILLDYTYLLPIVLVDVEGRRIFSLP